MVDLDCLDIVQRITFFPQLQRRNRRIMRTYSSQIIERVGSGVYERILASLKPKSSYQHNDYQYTCASFVGYLLGYVNFGMLMHPEDFISEVLNANPHKLVAEKDLESSVEEGAANGISIANVCVYMYNLKKRFPGHIALFFMFDGQPWTFSASALCAPVFQRIPSGPSRSYPSEYYWLEPKQQK